MRVDSDIRITFDCQFAGHFYAVAFRFDRSTRVPPFRENFSASVDRVSPGFESMSGNYLSLLYRPPYRPPLDSQSGQAIRSSTELYKSLISRRVLIFDTANYLQEAHLSSTLDNDDGERLQISLYVPYCVFQLWKVVIELKKECDYFNSVINMKNLF